VDTIIYVDGFNLYYNALRSRPATKWLDLVALCRALLPTHTIQRIKYFTAHVKFNADDPSQVTRQQMYLRALATEPKVEVIQGMLTRSEELRPLAKCAGHGRVKVIETKEKWSDVNLACHLLRDGYNNVFQAAVIVSGDSDFHLPIHIVREELQKTVGVISPSEHPSQRLLKEATFYKVIHPAILLSCQLPDILRDAGGEFHRPPEWHAPVSSVIGTHLHRATTLSW
jgi:uncharacterized LabA/DUF88 family protein